MYSGRKCDLCIRFFYVTFFPHLTGLLKFVSLYCVSSETLEELRIELELWFQALASLLLQKYETLLHIVPISGATSSVNCHKNRNNTEIHPVMIDRIRTG